MHILGPLIVLGWFALVFVSVILAVLHLIRKRLIGLAWGSLTVLGALLSFGLISAWAGVSEQHWSTSSPDFLIAVAIGVAGLACFIIGCLALRRKNT